ncbi:MAG: bifunctional 2',3'-cyclic-nucleotide 2'-phosphodiesterase/3'-nucleotidase [Rhizobiaceae bacterium]
MTGRLARVRSRLVPAPDEAADLLVKPESLVDTAPPHVHLRMLATTDIHVNLLAYDYYADRPNDTIGLSRTASLIETLRAEAVNTILFDNGDLLQGTPMGDFIAYERGMENGSVHPIMKGMNVLGYECSTLGNHEFNYGLSFMDKVLAGADFPFVCANLIRGAELADDPRADKLYLEPYVILDRAVRDAAGEMHLLRVGVIGFVPPQIMVWDSKNLSGQVAARDILEAAKAWVPEMKAAGADIVVALSHSGIDGQEAPMMENASLFLAGVEGVDAIFTGHQHLVFPGTADFAGIPGVDAEKGTLMGKPAVMAGFWGSHVGVIDLVLEKEAQKWRIVSSRSDALPIYKRTDEQIVPLVVDDGRVVAALKADHEATLEYVRRPVGRSLAPLFSYFSLIADDPSVQIVSDAQAWYMRALLKKTKWADLPLLSATAPFKVGGRGGPDYYTDVAAGDIAIKNVSDLYLYPNTIRAVEVSGRQLKNWLEMSAGIYNRIRPGGKDQPLINPHFPAFNFDVVDGVTYAIDVSQPARYDAAGNLLDENAGRIVDLRFDGEPIDPDRKFIVATNNYRAGGGGNFPEINDDVTVFVAPDTNRDVLVHYIIDQGTINPAADGNWRLAPLPDTSVFFESSPKARTFIPVVKGPVIEEAGEGKDGFALYRMWL